MRLQIGYLSSKSGCLTTATVVRWGREGGIDSTTLVPGNVIVLSAGDLVPADGRLIESPNLRTDESTLIGKSFPVDEGSRRCRNRHR